MKILILASQGPGLGDEKRIVNLLAGVNGKKIFEFHRGDLISKVKSGFQLFKEARILRPQLIVLEGTGLLAGLSVIFIKWFLGIPYIVSSGDSVGPFFRSMYGFWAFPFYFYEKRLLKNASGFIGWTPYLVGRAIALGAKVGISLPGSSISIDDRHMRRQRFRTKWKIPEGAIVFGIVGSIQWNKRVNYCYGLEVIQAIDKAKKPNLFGLVIGDGTGLVHLKSIVEKNAIPQIIFTGRLTGDELYDGYSSIDIGSVPQSCDAVGALRYSTKLPEYFANDVPVVTGPLPLYYDLESSWLKRINVRLPWDRRYSEEIGTWLSSLDMPELDGLKKGMSEALEVKKMFDEKRQQKRCAEFVKDVVEWTDTNLHKRQPWKKQ